MASGYVPIPADSDDEDDNMSITTPTSGYDGGSERSRSTDRSFFFTQAVSDSDEDPDEDPKEDPEEEDHTNTEPRSPRPIPPTGVRAHTFATARKRVPAPIMHQWTRNQSPEPFDPTSDPNNNNPSDSSGWQRTLSTLREWKNFGRMPSSVRRELSFTNRYEPILDTTPIIVDQMVIHENKLDIMEDAIMEMPGGEAFNELQERVDKTEGDISTIKESIESLKRHMTTINIKTNNTENLMESMEHTANECQHMMLMAHGFMEGSLWNERKKKEKEGKEKIELFERYKISDDMI